MGLNAFHRGEVALDITEGKMFIRFDLRERRLANQEIIHAKKSRKYCASVSNSGLGQRQIARACSISQARFIAAHCVWQIRLQSPWL